MSWRPCLYLFSALGEFFSLRSACSHGWNLCWGTRKDRRGFGGNLDRTCSGIHDLAARAGRTLMWELGVRLERVGGSGCWSEKGGGWAQGSGVPLRATLLALRYLFEVVQG